MSISPPKVIVRNIAVTAFTPDGGSHLQENNASYALAPYPIQNPPILIGVDCLSGVVNGTVTATFPNLPIRGSGNPLSATQNQPQTLTIEPGDLLMFEVNLQGASGQAIVSAKILDINNLPHVAPFVGAGTYKAFQVTATTIAPTRLTVWGKLYLQRGSGS